MKDTNRIKVAAGVVAGLLAAPAIAFGANAALSADATTAPAETAVVVEAAQAAPTTTNAATTEAIDTARIDMLNACWAEGLQLVDKESAGTATELELAALDALRDICEANGMPLPAGAGMTVAAAEEIVVYETVDVPAEGYVDDDEYEAYEDDEYDDADHAGYAEDDEEYEDDDDESYSEED